MMPVAGRIYFRAGRVTITNPDILRSILVSAITGNPVGADRSIAATVTR